MRLYHLPPFITASSNGRTYGFGPYNGGSNPSAVANSFAFGFKYSRAKDISSSGNHLIL